ncbi:hypothetical protein GvMRE_IIg579 [endosymbiont GvMRE of Glomus versiforme]|nr:hypothetical protein GvMRE_IIg579 [endosymbiont GvMRE of Glomus versiforme]
MSAEYSLISADEIQKEKLTSGYFFRSLKIDMKESFLIIFHSNKTSMI